MSRPARGLEIDGQGRYLRDVLDRPFTDRQLEIATHPLRPQLVIAGAGSGKTTVMAARVVHAIAAQGVAPARVLGLTFTNKAAGELATRVREALHRLRSAGLLPAADDGEPDPLDELPTVATYHSYAASIVRDHALRIGREPVTTLLSEAGRWQLATRVVRNAAGPFAALDWTTGSVVDKVLALAGEMAEHLAAPSQVRATDAEVARSVAALEKQLADSRKAVGAARARDELLTLVEAYAAAKQRLDLIDFGDQVALAATIATTSPVVGASERSRFGLVVLDEYQDTGVAQRILLSALFARHAVVAVGDPNQAIYGWRGASIGNLLRFGEHFADDGTPGAATTPATPPRPALPVQSLMESFRCGERILDIANVVAAGIGRDLPWRPKVDVERLSAAPCRAGAGEVILARVDTDATEAAWVADRFRAEVDAGRSPGGMAVLCRRTADFPRLHRALLDRGLPVEVVGLGGLLQMPEVSDVVAVLRVLADPAANAAAVRLLTGPRWRFGVRDLAALGVRAGRLARWAPASDQESEPAVGGDLAAALAEVTAQADPVDVAALLDAVESPGDAEDYSAEAWTRLGLLRAELQGLRRLTGQPLVELVTEVVRTIGLDIEIEAEPPGVAAARAANLAAFLDQAGTFAGLEGEIDLPAFLAYLEAAETAEDGFDIGGVSASDSIKLLTIHKAKGLEWDVVAVPGVVKDVFPSKFGRSAWTTNAHVLPAPLRGDRDDLPRVTAWDRGGIETYKQDYRAESLDEERRLAYVAVTRARERLLLSAYCWSATRKTPAELSLFLTEIRDSDATMTVDTWCDDPAADADHPLAGTRDADVPWPTVPDPAVTERRRRAAALVSEQLATLSDPTAGSPARPVGRAAQLSVLDAAGALSWREQADLVLDELRRARTPYRDVPLPRRLTASQVVQLAHDPTELARSLARPMPQRPVAQARRGSRFHAWVESLWQAKPLLDTDDLPGAGDADLTDSELERLQERFLADGWGELPPVAVERPFELVAGGRLLRGRIDAVYAVGPDGRISATGDAGGGYDVIDYKTGAVPQDFAAASLQLSVYRLAWADLAGVDPASVRAGFLYVRSGELKRPDHLLDREEVAALVSGAQPS